MWFDRFSVTPLAFRLMRSILLAVIRLYLVVAVLAGTAAGAGRTVLCVESNGRIVVEPGQGRCADRAPSDTGDITSADVATLPDGCGDCVDLPVGSHVLSAARHGISRAETPSLVSLPAALSSMSGDQPNATSQLVVTCVSVSRSAFESSRTTILRN